jgi:alkylation response protein AidB-like acyl-CoA dehydrogenase
MGVETRARLRLAATHAARACADVTRVMYDLAGGTAVYLDNGLQRRFRDGHVATQHIMVQASTYELIGRALFGQSLDVSTL